MRKRFLVVLLAGLAATCAVAAAAAPTPELVVGGGGSVRAGETVRVTWSALPPGAEEFELLLRCESPVSLTLRLTESEDPALPGLSWRVPALPCGRARLLLRFGEEGCETVWAQSEPFRITAGAPEATERIDLEGGELWIREGPIPAGHTLRAGIPTTVSSPGGTPLEANTPAAGPGRLSPPPAAPLTRPPSSPAMVVRPRASRAPMNLPLRI